MPKATANAPKDAVFSHQTSHAVLSDVMPSLAQLVDNSWTAVPRFVLGVDGTNLRSLASSRAEGVELRQA